MPRVKGGPRRTRRRKKLLKANKGYVGARGKLTRTAREARIRALKTAYVGRKLRKRDFRALWITRINAAARSHGMTYSLLIAGLKKAEVDLDRKMLADLAVREPQVFAQLVETARQAV